MSLTAESPPVMEAVSPSETVKEFKEILENNGIKDRIVQVIINNSGLKGENFASMTNAITVTFENAKPLELFMKSVLPSLSPISASFEDAKLFEKEATFFAHYLPAATEFCKAMGQDQLMEIYPKCYFADKKKLIFENLVLNKGFALIDKFDKQDFEAAKIALTSLAKHHAIAKAFIARRCNDQPEEFFKRFPNLDFESYNLPAMKDLFAPAIDSGLDIAMKLVEKHSTGKDAANALKMFGENKGIAYQKLLNALKAFPGEEKSLFLNHGDYWNNNMMFKMDKPLGKILGHVMIDFQLVRYNTPGVDIGYFFFTSVKQSVRRSMVRELLKAYLDALNTTGNELGCPIDLTYDELFLDYRKKFEYGFWVNIMNSNGIGFAVMRNIKVEEITDTDAFQVEYNKMVDEWILNNPEQAKSFADSTVELVKEYQELEMM